MIVPLVLAGLGVFFLVTAASAPPKLKMDAPPPPPPPTPVPPTPPQPNPLQAALLAQLAILMQQAATNPNLVDPQQLETLAYSLDAAGLPVQAQQAREHALRIRLARGGGAPPTPMPPTPKTPDVLLAQYTALLQQAIQNPTHTDPVMLDQLAIELDGAGMGYQAQVLRQAAQEVHRKRRENIPPLS